MVAATGIFCVPHARPNLLGRERELFALHELLSNEGSQARPSALCGTGGIGKTQLAATYCWTRRADLGPHPFYRAIVWLNVAGAQPVLGQLASYAAEVGLTGADEGQRAAALLGHLRGAHDALVVLDNLEQPSLLDRDLGDVPNARPRDLGCRVLITSRQPDLPGCAMQRVDFLQPPLDRDLLAREAGRDLPDSELGELRAILGGLPLAIVLVGRYLSARPDMRLADLVEKLHRHGADLVLSEIGDHTRTYHDRIGRNFNAVLAELWTALPSPLHTDVLLCMACLPEGAFVPAEILRFVVNLPPPDPLGLRREPLDEVLRGLGDTQLIERGTGGAQRIHPLIHAFASRRIDKPWRDRIGDRIAERGTDVDLLDRLDEHGVTALAQLLAQLVRFAPPSTVELVQLAFLFAQVAGVFREGVSVAAQVYLQRQVLGTACGSELEDRLVRAGKPFLRPHWRTRREHGLIRSLSGPGLDAASACAVTPDGRYAVVGHRSGAVALWDTANGAFTISRISHSSAIMCCSLAASGQLVTMDRSGRAVSWTIDAGRLVAGKTVETVPPQINLGPWRQRWLVSIAHDAGLVGSISTPGHQGPLVRRVSDGCEIGLPGLAEGAEAICFDHAGEHLAIGADKSLYLLSLSDAARGRPRCKWAVVDEARLAPLCLGEGWILVADARQLKLMELATGRLTWQIELRCHAAKMLGEIPGFLAASGGVLCLIPIDQPEPVRVLDYGFEIVDFALAADNRLLVTVADDGIAKLWSIDLTVAAPAELDLGGHVFAVRGVGGGRIAAFSEHGLFTLLDLVDGRPVEGPEKLAYPAGGGFAISQDGLRLAFASFGNRALMLCDRREPGAPRETAITHWAANGLVTDPEGTRLLTADYEGVARIIRVADTQVLHQVKVEGKLYGAAATPAFDLAVLGADGGRLVFWRTDGGDIREIRSETEDEFFDVAVSGDGRLVLAAGIAGNVVLWRSGMAAPRTVGRHAGIAPGCALSVEHGIGATVSHDGTVALWQLESGRRLLSLSLGAPLISVCLIGLRLVVGDCRGCVHALEIVLP